MSVAVSKRSTPRELLWAFLPPQSRGADSTSRSPVALDMLDVPALLKDFRDIVGSLEKKCGLARATSAENALGSDPSVQLQARICASMNVRLNDFFYSPAAGRIMPPSCETATLADDTFRINKLKKDFEMISPKFHELCSSYPLVPDVPVTLATQSASAVPAGSEPAISDRTTAWSGSGTTVPVTGSHGTVSKGGGEEGLWRLGGRLINAFESKVWTAGGSGERDGQQPQCGATMADVRKHVFNPFHDVDSELRKEQLEAVQQIRTDVENLRRIQEGMIANVALASDGLNEVESSLQETAEESASAKRELAKAAKQTSQWWTPAGAGAGALAGTAAGAFLGPPGMIAGAAIGGAFGLVTGGALTQRHRSHMDRAVRESDSLPVGTSATSASPFGEAQSDRQQRREKSRPRPTAGTSGQPQTASTIYHTGTVRNLTSANTTSSGGGGNWLASFWKDPKLLAPGGGGEVSPLTTATSSSSSRGSRGRRRGREGTTSSASSSSTSTSSSSSGSLIGTSGILGR